MKIIKSVASLALVIALVAPTASAETRHKTCEDFASISYLAMKLHQSGVSLSETLSLINDDDSMNADQVLAIENLVLLAYNSPRFLTETAQDRHAATFRDKMHVICLS